MPENVTLSHYSSIKPIDLLKAEVQFPLLDDYFVPVNMRGPFPNKEYPTITPSSTNEEAVELSLEEPFGFATNGPNSTTIYTPKLEKLTIDRLKPGWWNIELVTDEPYASREIDIANMGLNVFIVYTERYFRENPLPQKTATANPSLLFYNVKLSKNNKCLL